MDTIRRMACLAALGACSGCVLPQRDNPNDPHNKPVAVLDVVTVEGGRATPFELDASGSYDPRRPEDTLRFQWELHDPQHDAVGDGELDDFDDIPGNESVVFPTFPEAFAVQSSNGEGSILRSVRVKVIAADGAFSIAEGTIVVRNERPIVDPGEDLFISTSWTEPVVLDALGGGAEPTSIDPDGDDVFYSWTQVSGPAAVLDTSLDPVFKRRVQFVPPQGPGTRSSMTFRLDGSDGMSAETAFLRVHFGTQVWIGSREPTRLIRSFPEFVSRTELVDLANAPVGFSDITAIAVTSSGNIWTAEGSAGGTVIRLLDEDFRQKAEAFVADYDHPQWAEAEGESLCLLTSQFEGFGDSVFLRVDPLGVPQYSLPVSGAVRTHAAGPGECWLVRRNEVAIVDPVGALQPIASGFDVLHRSTVDEQGTLWVSEMEAFTHAPKRILRITPAGETTDFGMFEQDPSNPNLPTVTDLAPRKGGGVWIHDAIRDLRVLSESGVFTLTDAPKLRLEANGSLPRRQFVSDLADGTIWLADSQSGDLVHLVDAGDTVREIGRLPIDSIAPGAPYLLTPHRAKRGAIIASATGDESWLFRIPTHMHSTETVEAGLITTNPSSISGDVVRGTAWLPDGSTYERRVLRTAHTGRHVARVPVFAREVEATSDGGVWIGSYDFSLETGQVLRASPTGEVVGSFTIDGFFDDDLDATDTRACAVVYQDDGDLAGIRIDEGSASSEVLFEAPAGVEDDGQCWIDRADGAVWFHTHSFPCSLPSIGGVLRRFEPGESTPSLVLTSDGGGAIGCAMSGDLAGGVWVESASGMARRTAGGLTGETVGAVGTVRPCAGAPLESSCREVWATDSELSGLFRYSADGTLLQTYETPGLMVGFDVVP